MVGVCKHRIPSKSSCPYICVEGPDRRLWFWESGTAKIGCFGPGTEDFTEFRLPKADATPIGIALGGDANLWLPRKCANKTGRISLNAALPDL